MARAKLSQLGINRERLSYFDSDAKKVRWIALKDLSQHHSSSDPLWGYVKVNLLPLPEKPPQSDHPPKSTPPGDLLIQAAVSELLSPGDPRLKDRFLESVSFTESQSAEFLKVLRQNATSEQLIALETTLDQLLSDLRSPQISYGIPGGIRLPLAIGFAWAVHITLHGFNSTFILPENRMEWAELSSRANNLLGLLLLYAGGKDYATFRRELGPYLDHKSIVRGVVSLIDDIREIVAEAKNGAPNTLAPVTEQNPLIPLLSWIEMSKPSEIDGHTRFSKFKDFIRMLFDSYGTQLEFQRLMTDKLSSVSPADARVLLSGLPTHAISLTPQVHGLDEMADWESLLQYRFREWFRSHPNHTAHDLLVASFKTQQQYEKNHHESHRLSSPAKWTLSAMSLYTAVWGWLTNMGKDPTLMDFHLLGTNIDQMIRHGWIDWHGNLLGTAVVGATSLWYTLTLPQRGVRRMRLRESSPLFSPYQWNIIRRAILLAEREREQHTGLTGAWEELEHQSPEELLSSLRKTSEIENLKIKYPSKIANVCRLALNKLFSKKP